MNKSILAVFLVILFCGCSQNAALAEEELSDIRPDQEQAPISEPLDGMPTVDWSETTTQEPPSLELAEVCMCEWESWENSGLFCVGVVCSMACPPEVSQCREARHACISDY